MWSISPRDSRVSVARSCAALYIFLDSRASVRPCQTTSYRVFKAPPLVIDGLTRCTDTFFHANPAQARTKGKNRRRTYAHPSPLPYATLAFLPSR